MALLKWGDDDGTDKQDDPFAPTPHKVIQSVQDSWQPTQDGTLSSDGSTPQPPSQSDNYLLSDQYAQIEQQKRQQDAADAAARAEAARQSEIARQNANARAAAAREAQVVSPASPKYAPAKGNKGFGGFLKNIGAGIEQGVGALGDIAIEGGGVLGSIGKNNQQLVNQMAEVEKVRGWLHSQKDINGGNIIGTQDVDKNATRIANGQGTARDYLTVGGKGLQAGLDSTMFLNPARMALKGTVAPAAAESAGLLARILAKPAVRYAGRDAAFYGGLQGAATGASTYGQTGNAGEAAKNAAIDALIGGLLQGTMDVGGHVVHKGYQSLIPVANKTLESLRRPGKLHLGDEVANLADRGEGVLTTSQDATPTPADGNVTFKNDTPAGQVKKPSEFKTDKPESFKPTKSEQPTMASQRYDELNRLNERAKTEALNPEEKAMRKVLQSEKDAITVKPKEVTPVAEGTVRSGEPIPTAKNMPTAKSEQVRALKEAKAGKSQADEAQINQQLQQLESNVPAYARRTPETAGAADYQYGRTGKTNLPDDTFSADARNRTNSAELGDTPYDTVPAYVRKNADKRIPEVNQKLSEQDKVLKYLQSDMTQVKKFKDKQMIAKAYRVSKELGDRVRNRISERDATFNSSKEANVKEAVTTRNKTAQELRDTQRASQLEADKRAKAEPDTIDYNNTDIPAFMRNKAMKKGVPQSPVPVTPKPKSPAPDKVTPAKAPVEKSNLPEGMQAPKGEVTPAKDGFITKQELADRIITRVNHVDDAKTQLAEGLGIPLDSDLTVPEMLKVAGADAKSSQRVEASLKKMSESDAIYNKIQEANSADFVAGKAARPKIDRKRNAALRDSLEALQSMASDIKYMKRQGSVSERAIQTLEGIVKYRATNVLTSLGLFERNAVQEVFATAFRALQNPIKTTTGMVGYGSSAASSVKSFARNTAKPPRGIASKAKHTATAVYKAGMIPTDALQAKRAGMYRDEIARQGLKLQGNKNPSIAEIRELSKRGGAIMESVVQMYTGVDSQIIPRKAALRAGDALMRFLRTGTDADLKAVNAAVKSSGTVSDGIIKQLQATGMLKNKAGRALMSVINGTFMFTRTAVNATRNSTEIFNPFSPSLVDSIGRTGRSKTANVALGLKAAPVKLAALSAIPIMYVAGNAGYNDGDDVDKPRGVWIKMPNGSYVTSRSTGLLELPIGIMVMGSEMYKDSQDGKMRDPRHYGGILMQSLPYIDSAEQVSGALSSLVEAFFGGDGVDNDGGYQATAYGINAAKSLVPFSNNGAHPYFEGKKGNSVNAKSSYANKEVPDGEGGTKKVADPMQWFKNTMYNAYPGMFPEEYAGLKDSRDAAGRVRTKDNQGVLINKTINDKGTATYNEAISSAVDYARKNGLGSGTQEMFNTFDNGKNNNFKTVGGQIWAASGKGGKENNLKVNKNMADLAQQMRDGYFGGGEALLTVDGQNLYSDVSMPNANGTKNSSKPINMASIKNAIAQTDLPKEQTDRLYAISQESQALYDEKVATKQMTYAEYKVVKADMEKEYVSILNGSESYKKMNNLMTKLDGDGFFAKGGLGSTRAGQTYLWNSLNALLGEKGKTPAAEYPKDEKGFTPWGRRGGGGRRGSGFGATNKPGDRGNTGIKWTPVGKRQLATVAAGKYTPVDIRVKLGNKIKKDRSQNYSDRSF